MRRLSLRAAAVALALPLTLGGITATAAAATPTAGTTAHGAHPDGLGDPSICVPTEFPTCTH